MGEVRGSWLSIFQRVLRIYNRNKGSADFEPQQGPHGDGLAYFGGHDVGSGNKKRKVWMLWGIGLIFDTGSCLYWFLVLELMMILLPLLLKCGDPLREPCWALCFDAGSP